MNAGRRRAVEGTVGTAYIELGLVAILQCGKLKMALQLRCVWANGRAMARFLVRFVFGAMILSLATASCGYSEEEWQVQLSKYNAEVEKNRAANHRIANLEQEIALAKDHVGRLEEQLEGMGMDVSRLNEALTQSGEASAQLAADMNAMRKALAEYKARAAVLERVKAQMAALRGKLDALTALGLDVTIRKNRMIISLPGDVLFDSGRTELKKEGKDVLLAVAKVISGDSTLVSRDFQVAGHTDNSPLRGGQYVDNWGLSLMRARTVLVFMVSPVDAKPSGVGANRIEPGGGMPAARWSASGFGETDPVAPNTNPENKQKNRRVELIVTPNVEEMLDMRSLTVVI